MYIFTHIHTHIHTYTNTHILQEALKLEPGNKEVRREFENLKALEKEDCKRVDMHVYVYKIQVFRYACVCV